MLEKKMSSLVDTLSAVAGTWVVIVTISEGDFNLQPNFELPQKIVTGREDIFHN